MQRVKIRNKASGGVDMLDITHAQNLLNLEKKVGFDNYELSDDNFTFQDGAIIKRNNRKNQKAEESSPITEGEV